jgi:hypothetical protein
MQIPYVQANLLAVKDGPRQEGHYSAERRLPGRTDPGAPANSSRTDHGPECECSRVEYQPWTPMPVFRDT